MTKKCRGRLCISGLARHFQSVFWAFQPSCCIRFLMSSFRPSLSALDSQTFIHVLVVLTVFLFRAFSGSFCISSGKKSKNIIVFSVVVVTLSYHTFFAVILNQLNLRNFSASVNYLLFALRCSRCTDVTSKVLSLFSKFTGIHCGKLGQTS